MKKVLVLFYLVAGHFSLSNVLGQDQFTEKENDIVDYFSPEAKERRAKKYEEISRNQEETVRQFEREKIEKEQREKLLVLTRKKQKCREYGFKDDTDGMGLCLIELDKLEVIEQHLRTQNEAIDRQQADAQRQRESQALINLGNMLMNMGTPASINNRNEETKGMDRICYYETATGKKALTVSAVDICPLSYPY